MIHGRKATSLSGFVSRLCFLISFSESVDHSSGLSVRNPPNQLFSAQGTRHQGCKRDLSPGIRVQRYISEHFFSAACRQHLYYAVFLQGTDAFLPEAEGQPGTCPPSHPHTKEVMTGCQRRELCFLGAGKRKNMFASSTPGWEKMEGISLISLLAGAPL